MKVITLCGSTRFKDEFNKQNARLTMEGNIVISVGIFGHTDTDGVQFKEGGKEKLDKIHLHKIDMADEIFVINVGGYIGSSTKNEIEYAKSKGKTVNYLEKLTKCYCCDDELHSPVFVQDGTGETHPLCSVCAIAFVEGV
jgi:hypothetical protein